MTSRESIRTHRRISGVSISWHTHTSLFFHIYRTRVPIKKQSFFSAHCAQIRDFTAVFIVWNFSAYLVNEWGRRKAKRQVRRVAQFIRTIGWNKRVFSWFLHYFAEINVYIEPLSYIASAQTVKDRRIAYSPFTSYIPVLYFHQIQCRSFFYVTTRSV